MPIIDIPASFTPAPWTFNLERREVTGGPFNQRICAVYGTAKGEMERNAHLIAESPDLLKTLERLLPVAVEGLLYLEKYALTEAEINEAHAKVMAAKLLIEKLHHLAGGISS